MIHRLHLTVIIAIAVGSIAITRLAAGEIVSLGWFTSIGVAVGANVVALSTFNLWIWRWRLWQGWFVKRPQVWGEWSLTIRSHWTDPNSGNQIEPIPGTLTAKQTYSSIHVRLQTPESKGDLIAATIVAYGDEMYRLAGIYRNEPGLSARGKSQIHNGAFLLEIDGDPNKPTAMRGHYWTDRGTMGELEAVRPS